MGTSAKLIRMDYQDMHRAINNFYGIINSFNPPAPPTSFWSYIGEGMERRGLGYDWDWYASPLAASRVHALLGPHARTMVLVRAIQSGYLAVKEDQCTTGTTSTNTEQVQNI